MNKLFDILCANVRSAKFRDSGSRSRMRRILTLAACVFGMCTAVSASAACSFMNGSLLTGSINMGSITVPANVQVGTVIVTKTGSYDSLIGHQGITCGDNVASKLSFLMSGSGTSGIYPTNIPGIGIRIYAWSNGAYYSAPTSPTLTPNSWGFQWAGASGNYGTGSMQIQVDLVATGQIGLSGTNTLSYNVSPWVTAQAADGSGQMTVSNLAVTATVTTRTCSVTTTSVDVTLPQAYAGKLSTTGSTTGATPFSLGINCSQGAKVMVTLTDASDVSNRSTTLGLAPGSSAAGVGLQILSGSTPIPYGPDSATEGNTNQWSAGTAAGGPMTIPLTVQYVRTPETLTPGMVKGTATFTMSYQ
ncbi:fimbrial protein [Paraburkholderia sediminicola]|uniref:fimbrial protein n=1 Tax=Paraburkholderia sediminicola TaxID=458836 RepID=UPI0038B9DB20